VFVSSHHMSEMSMTAEHLIVIGRGRLIADSGVDEVVQRASKKSVRVRSPQMQRLVELVFGPDVSIDPIEPSLVEVHGLSSEQVGTIAAEHQIVL
jgi:ABC-2 type transport system ATP-binding protein